MESAPWYWLYNKFMKLARQLDKVGVAGASLTALCCLGVTAAVSLLSALGLGFMINDAILMPLFAVFIILALSGLAADVRHHHRWSAFLLALAGAAGLVLFAIFLPSRPGAFLAVAALVAASAWNLRLRSHPKERS